MSALKYISNNRLFDFEFHDAVLTLESYIENRLIVHADFLNIHKDAEQNPFGTDMEITSARLSFEEFSIGARKKGVVAHLSDGCGVVDLVWFQHTKYVYQNYKVNTEYIVFGKPTVYNGRYQFAHPDIDKAEDLQLSEMGLQPYYSTTETMKKRGMSSRSIERIIKSLLEKLSSSLPETLPPYIIDPLHLCSRNEAVHHIHYPHNTTELQRAQVRLKFEELFYVQLNILRYASDHRRKYRGYIFKRVGEQFNGFYRNNLPFPLTDAQKRVMHEIRDDMGSGRQMNRLLQGDVGSGKTLVAVMSMLIAIDNGYQAALMAPTEILAEQHLQTIMDFLQGMEIRVALLTGIVKGKRRQEILDAAACAGDDSYSHSPDTCHDHLRRLRCQCH